jgi:hypothetical protein
MDPNDSDDDSEDMDTVPACGVFWKLLYNSTSIEPMHKPGPAPE